MKFLEFLSNPREIRRRLGMNQQQFWTKIGVTQSGGSRYESGRNMPKPVQELVKHVLPSPPPVDSMGYESGRRTIASVQSPFRLFGWGYAPLRRVPLLAGCACRPMPPDNPH